MCQCKIKIHDHEQAFYYKIISKIIKHPNKNSQNTKLILKKNNRTLKYGIWKGTPWSFSSENRIIKASST